MTLAEVERILMAEPVEDTERDYDIKHEILCEELVNDFDVEFEE